MANQGLEIGLIDYGMGNLHSVRRAFDRLGNPVRIIRDATGLIEADALILPGVGAFDPAMANLEATGLIPELKSWILDGGALLGICLGLQLLFEGSDEGSRDGLGVFPGRVRSLPAIPGERIPHMGWAPLTVRHDSPLLHRNDPQAWVYFVHSYAAAPEQQDCLAATAPFGHEDVTAMVWKNRVGACQFHPEKSSDCGEKLLRRWLIWLKNKSASSSQV